MPDKMLHTGTLREAGRLSLRDRQGLAPSFLRISLVRAASSTRGEQKQCSHSTSPPLSRALAPRRYI